MGQGFAFPRSFATPKDLPSALARNNRELTTFLNDAVVTFNADGTLSLPTDVTVDGDVSFASSTYDWNATTLAGSWINYGSGYAECKYRIDHDGTVHLQGLIRDGAAALITTLPSGFRPSQRHIFVIFSYSGAIRCDVDSNGEVKLAAAPPSWVSLSGITFRV